MRSALLALILGTTVLQPLAAAHVYYVATTGSDANSGTETKPFRTLAHGVSVLKPGDTLYVRAGRYDEALLDNIPGGTSWSSPVTVAAYPGEIAILAPEGQPWVIHFGSRQKYVVIDGLVLDAAGVSIDVVKITYGFAACKNVDTCARENAATRGTRSGARVADRRADPSRCRALSSVTRGWRAARSPSPYRNAVSDGAHHIRLIRCELKNAPREGVLITSRKSVFNELIDLNIHHNGSSGRGHGMYISTSNNLIEGCRIHHNAGYGVHVYEEDFARSGRPNKNIVRDNRIFENGTVSGSGMILSSGRANAAYNNLVWGNGVGGIKVAYFDPTNTKVFNNTVYGNVAYGIEIESDSSSAVFKNNLLYANGLPEIQGSGSGTILNRNLVGVDPLFVDADGRDFHLRSGSPAIDAGATIKDVKTDFAGRPRPQGAAYDIGAYENVGSTPKTAHLARRKR